MTDGSLQARSHIDVTTWSDVGSRDALALVAASVAEMVGFEIALISVVQGDRMFAVAVEGSNDAAAAMLGLTSPLAAVLPELDRADDWGRFRFVPHDRVDDGDDLGWVPDIEPIEAPDAWHPLDLLIAPLYSEDDALIGLLSIDVPLSGRIPGPPQRQLLGRYAHQAERALRDAVERDELAERIRLAEAARRVVRFATSQDDLESVLDDCRHPLLEGFRADYVSVRSYPYEEFPESGTPSVLAPPDVVAAVRTGVRSCWERQRVALVGSTNENADLIDDRTHGFLSDHASSVGVGTLMVVPFGAGHQCLGHVFLGRKDPALRWSPDEQLGALDIARDIGQAVVNARNLAREQRLVGELRRLATYKSEVLSTVSHELKNPLSAVVGYLEILEGDTTISGDTRRSVNALDRAARRMARVVDDLLLLAEVEDPDTALPSEPMDARPLVDESLELIRGSAEQRELTVRVVAPEHDVPTCCDPADLDRVLTNLLSNAVKYTPRGGAITVSLVQHVGEVELSVADAGIGISVSDQARLFTEFFRSTNPQAVAQPGTGLGLTICARIVERHGGRIEVDSELGVGSTFRVYLPAPD